MKKTIIALTALIVCVCAILCACNEIEPMNTAYYRYVMLPGKAVSETSSESEAPLSGSVIPDHDTAKTSGATVTVDGDATYYESIADAWSAANSATTGKVTLKLWQDWTAAEGNFGKTDAAGFSSIGALVIEERAASSLTDESNSFVFDLNGYTVNAARTAAAENGYVINLKCNQDSSKYGAQVTIKNGTVKGGYNTLNGGGIIIKAYNTKISLKNLVITGNKTDDTGAGVYESTFKSVIYLQDVNITGNHAARYGGGYASYYIADDVKDATDISINGEVKICDNTNGYGESTGFFYDREKYVSDMRTVGNARFVDFDNYANCDIKISSMCNCPLFISYESDVPSLCALQNDVFSCDREGSVIGILITGTRQETKGCRTYSVEEKGILHIVY